MRSTVAPSRGCRPTFRCSARWSARCPSTPAAGRRSTTYQLVTRLDFNVGPSTNAYLRYAYQRQDFLDGTNANSPFAGFDTSALGRNHNLLVSVTRLWSSRLTTQTKVVFTNLISEQPLGDAAAGADALHVVAAGRDQRRQRRVARLPALQPGHRPACSEARRGSSRPTRTSTGSPGATTSALAARSCGSWTTTVSARSRTPFRRWARPSARGSTTSSGARCSSSTWRSIRRADSPAKG